MAGLSDYRSAVAAAADGLGAAALWAVAPAAAAEAPSQPEWLAALLRALRRAPAGVPQGHDAPAKDAAGTAPASTTKAAGTAMGSAAGEPLPAAARPAAAGDESAQGQSSIATARLPEAEPALTVAPAREEPPAWMPAVAPRPAAAEAAGEPAGAAAAAEAREPAPAVAAAAPRAEFSGESVAVARAMATEAGVPVQAATEARWRPESGVAVPQPASAPLPIEVTLRAADDLAAALADSDEVTDAIYRAVRRVLDDR